MKKYKIIFDELVYDGYGDGVQERQTIIEAPDKLSAIATVMAGWNVDSIIKVTQVKGKSKLKKYTVSFIPYEPVDVVIEAFSERQAEKIVMNTRNIESIIHVEEVKSKRKKK